VSSHAYLGRGDGEALGGRLADSVSHNSFVDFRDIWEEGDWLVCFWCSV
jgi:hypothetical protein